MKATLFTMTICFIGSMTSQAQCTSTVHQNSVSISSAQQLVASNKKYWICDNQTLILKGSQNSIWVEEGAILSLDGDSNEVHALKNSTVTIAGNLNIVEIEKNATYTNNGTNTSKTGCTTISFDYSSAPSGGCTPYLGIDGLRSVRETKVYPSPATSVLFVEYPGNVNDIVNVKIYDVSARMVKNLPNITGNSLLQIDISSLPEGIYTIQAESDQILINQKFSIKR